eukprot:13521790-Alexandrium_andersonii.AAC.1
MSASLVGSEMCIRDRLTKAWGRCCRRSRQRAFTGAQTSFRGGSLTSEAVSYTHLTLPTICSV